jgi:hypothetical protein
VDVIAFSTPDRPNWRWRIVDYAGVTIEESEGTFATIGAAVAEGVKRLERMNVFARSLRPSAYPRGAAYPRPR